MPQTLDWQINDTQGHPSEFHRITSEQITSMNAQHEDLQYGETTQIPYRQDLLAALYYYAHEWGLYHLQYRLTEECRYKPNYHEFGPDYMSENAMRISEQLDHIMETACTGNSAQLPHNGV